MMQQVIIVMNDILISSTSKSFKMHTQANISLFLFYFLSFIYSMNGRRVKSIQECRNFLDYATRNIFTKLSYLRLLMTGSAVKSTNDIRAAAKHHYGEKSLTDVADNGIKCFAVSVCRDESSKDIEPFLLRTYAHPLDDGGHADHEHKDSTISYDRKEYRHCAGSSEVKLWEAVAATGAAPGAFDRVKVNINGKTKSLADGGIFGNCPVAIALEEAQSLWPNRPIGVVLSFGLDPTENDLAQNAVDAVRLNNPGLYYQRIIVPEIADYNFLETDPKKHLEMEEKVKAHMRTPLVRERLTLMLDLLFDYPSRRSGQKDMEEVSSNKDDSNGNRDIDED